jgi:uncharacterized membrane protein (UPF0127 family)
VNGWRARLGGLPASELPGGLVVHVASSRGARRRGLAGLRSLPADRALHLRPCRAVHTFGMRFALDLVWLDADGGVVRVDRDVAPRRHRLCGAARSVVELSAGSADRLLSSGYTAAR